VYCDWCSVVRLYGYCILGCLCIVTVVCCCASVWGNVCGGLCIVSVVFFCEPLWRTVFWGPCVL